VHLWKSTPESEVDMGEKEWTFPKLTGSGRNDNYIKKSYYIEAEYEKILTALSTMTGKEISYLVNEAIGDLVDKYQPLTNIDLLK
jgi:hypothetical protein